MATKKQEQAEIRPIIFDEEPYSVLLSLQGGGEIKSIDGDKLGDSFSCFVLRASVFYGLPSWDKGDPDKGREPSPDFWTQLLFVPCVSPTADNKLVQKVSDRTVCQLFKRGKHLASFSAACKTTRSNEDLEDMALELGIEGLQPWRLVVWTPEFIGKTNKHGSYSALKWIWNLPVGEQIVTYTRVVQMYRDYSVNPLELEYEVDQNLLCLDTLAPQDKREFKRLIAAKNQPTLEAASEALILAPRQVEQAQEA